MVWYQFRPSWQILLLPALRLARVPGVARSRPVDHRSQCQIWRLRYVIPFLVQFGLYVSPVGFSSSIVPERWRLLYSLNPMAGVIHGFRWCLLGGQAELSTGVRAGYAVRACFSAGDSAVPEVERTFADSIELARAFYGYVHAEVAPASFGPATEGDTVI